MSPCPFTIPHAGIPEAGNRNSLTAGLRGSGLRQDLDLIQKVARLTCGGHPMRRVT